MFLIVVVTAVVVVVVAVGLLALVERLGSGSDSQIISTPRPLRGLTPLFSAQISEAAPTRTATTPFPTPAVTPRPFVAKGNMLQNAVATRSSVLGQYYQGRTLTVSVVSIDRVYELSYSSSSPGKGMRHLRLTTSKIDMELVVVHLKVENHTVTTAIFNVDRKGAELRDFLSKKYFPIDVAERVKNTNSPPGPRSESARLLNLQPDGTFTPGQGFISGHFELARNMGIDGWLVFEAPRGTEFRQVKWRAGDSLTITF